MARWVRRALVGVVLALLLAVPSASGTWMPLAERQVPHGTRIHVGTDFYDLPHNLPGEGPGDVIWAEDLGVHEGVRTFRVLYRSLSLDGRPIAVSGMVLAPTRESRRSQLPIVAVAPGVMGLGDQCASSPSLHPRALDYAQEGYVVAVTDYEGLGPPGEHPFLVGESQARSVIDSVRAARQIAPDAGERFVVSGHGQGAHAALFAGQIIRRWAPELDLRGIVAVAPPALAREGELGPLVAPALPDTFSALGGYRMMVVSSWAATYPELELEDLLTPEGMALVDWMRDRCAYEILHDLVGKPVHELVHTQGAENEAWLARRTENAPGFRRIRAPVLILHGEVDDVTGPNQGKLVMDRICALGGRAFMKVYPGRDNIGVIDDYPEDAVPWVRARFAAERSASGCPPVQSLNR